MFIYKSSIIHLIKHKETLETYNGQSILDPNSDNTVTFDGVLGFYTNFQEFKCIQ